MGAGASTTSSFVTLQEESAKPFDARDCDTPRGESAKNEVMRLRSMITDQKNKTCSSMAKEKFAELDDDKSGFLEKAELEKVVEWVLSCGNTPDADKVETRVNVMARVDANKDGQLDQAEFIQLFEVEMRRMDIIRRARAKFIELDADNSGYLEGPEIIKVIDWVIMIEHTPSDKAVV